VRLALSTSLIVKLPGANRASGVRDAGSVGSMKLRLAGLVSLITGASLNDDSSRGRETIASWVPLPSVKLRLRTPSTGSCDTLA